MKISSYRLDIQFLRALAVISVILYHFKFSFFSGGFVGVDVFFVISGYLISASIIKTRKEGRFNFSAFYFNRLKRLYPALLVTIIITYFFGFILFSPMDFEALSSSAVYSSIGSSNISFWLSSDYFDNFSKLKPLLHTWSLSVEFQFYLFWPVILIFLAYIGKSNLIYISALTALTGYLAYEYLNIDGSGAFYLTPFRIHEFSIGAVVYFLEDKFKRKAALDYLFLLAGYILIIYSVVFFDIARIKFPGLYVWIPVLGTALAIFAGKNISSIQSETIFTRPFSYIGEISYSLYLVHWPIFVFFSYLYLDVAVSFYWQFVLIVITFVSALSMYYLVEKPFRKNIGSVSTRSYVLICLTAAVIVVATAASSFFGKGWLWRLPDVLQDANNINVEEMHKFTWMHQVKYGTKTNYLNSGKEKLFIIGDSQAADLINLLVESGHDENFDIVARTIHTECGVPYVEEDKREDFFKKVNLYTIQKPELIKACEMQMGIFNHDAELIEKADRVFLAMNWEGFSDPYLNDAIDKFTSTSESAEKVWVFGRKTLLKNSIEIFNSYQKGTYINIDRLEMQAAKLKSKPKYNSQEILSRRKDISFVDMLSFICPRADKCYVLTDDKKIILYDVAHFSPDGARFLGDRFYEMIK